MASVGWKENQFMSEKDCCSDKTGQQLKTVASTKMRTVAFEMDIYLIKLFFLNVQFMRFKMETFRTGVCYI